MSLVYVLISEFQAPPERIEECLPAHVEWLVAGYGEGRVMVSGRRLPPEGGVIVALARDDQDIDSWMATDPFVEQGLVEYRTYPFEATDFPKRSAAFDDFVRGWAE
jgi:uncharacterized protein YciI